MATKTKSIIVLEDGKLSAMTTQNKEVYIQPPIMVETHDNRLDITVRDKGNENVLVDTAITTIDGVAFGAGTFADLETALRLMAQKANQLYFGGGGTAGAELATEATLDEVKVQGDILNIGAAVDLTDDDAGDWPGFPFTLDGSSIAVRLMIGAIEYKFASSAVITKVEDLVEELGRVQSLLTFGKQDDTKLLVGDGTETVDSTTTITFLLASTDELEYGNPSSSWTELVAVPVSVFQQIYEQQKSTLAYIKSIEAGTKKGPNGSPVAVAADASSVILAEENDERVELIILNNGTGVLYVKHGLAASTASFTYTPLIQNESLKIDKYTGTVTGIWTGANGNAQVTETT